MLQEDMVDNYILQKFLEKNIINLCKCAFIIYSSIILSNLEVELFLYGRFIREISYIYSWSMGSSVEEI